jgi:hypothetical protein
MNDEHDLHRQTEPRSALVPPGRRPPTAVGAATPEPPEFRRPHILWHPSPVVRFLAKATNEYIDMWVEGLGRLLRSGRSKRAHHVRP